MNAYYFFNPLWSSLLWRVVSRSYMEAWKRLYDDDAVWRHTPYYFYTAMSHDATTLYPEYPFEVIKGKKRCLWNRQGALQVLCVPSAKRNPKIAKMFESRHYELSAGARI